MAFEQEISNKIWRDKYQYKSHDGVEYDKTVEHTWRRVAKALSQPETERVTWEREFYSAMEGFKFVPAGRILSGAGTGRNVTLMNCYVMGDIKDDMRDIFDSLTESALTMQQGGGIGNCYSTLRPEGAHVKGVDADASGPLTFMDVWNSMCKTVMSAGSRRGAMMATMHVWHPDIEKFIEAKRDSDRLRMFNLSVLITDDFMEAVKNDGDWDLVFNGKVYKTLKARVLWNKIMIGTYSYAEPGVIFIDRINIMNNLNYMEVIRATNPCGEQPLPAYGACLLGSINLVVFIKNAFTNNASIDFDLLEKVVNVAIRMLDNVNDVTNFPLEKQKENALSKRRIGLGITGLADILVMLNTKYGSEESIKITEYVTRFIAETSYRQSIELAKEKGQFPALDREKYVNNGFVSGLDDDIKNDILKYGIRNSHLTSIAPTGTISMCANNVSSGIEPIFAHKYERKVLQNDGSHTVDIVKDYAVHLYEEMFPNEPLNENFVTAQTITPEDHVLVQATAQKWVDTSISKTINVPEDISLGDFENVYMLAYEMGCKGCTTYRPNDITGSVLTAIEDPVPDDGGACEIKFDKDTGQMIRTCE